MSLHLISEGLTVFGINPESGLPEVLRNAGSGQDYLAMDPQPFFVLRLRDGQGAHHELAATDAATTHVEQSDGETTVYYNFLGGRNIRAKCRIGSSDDGTLQFGIEITNRTGWLIKSVEYPVLLLPSTLESEGSDWTLWDSCIGNGNLIRGFPNAYTEPNLAFQGSFSEPLQMCACGTSSESLYFCTMDTAHHAKNLQPLWTGKHLKLSNTHFFDQDKHSEFTLPYPVGLSLLADGEWYAAAEKYRDWTEGQTWTSKRLWEREDVPPWWLESPVVLSIKERAKRNSDMGQLPSPWCHPLEKGIPRITELAERLDTPFLVQVFHWEQNGAFINGEHLPPLSGDAGTRRFFDQLHEKGHRGGVYILPLKWTLQGKATGYDGSRFFEDHRAMDNLCVDPDGVPITSHYDWQWRKRYHMCAATDMVRQQIVECFRLFSELGADYLQFDTFNGRLYDCGSRDHGHYPGPGRWQNDAAVSLIDEIFKATGPLLFTFEGEPTEAMLQTGHGFVERGLQPRANKGYEKVPLYQFVYHQYTQAFSGENAGSWNTPDNFYLVTAITAVNGDMLMINLGEAGRIAMQTHEIDHFDQTIETVFPLEEIEGFIREVARFRRTVAREFLVLGKMERAPTIVCGIGKILQGRVNNPANQAASWTPPSETDYHITIPAVLGTTWTSPDGVRGVVLINYTQEQQTVGVSLRDPWASVNITDSEGESRSLPADAGSFDLDMEPLSCVLVTAAG